MTRRKVKRGGYTDALGFQLGKGPDDAGREVSSAT